MTLEDLLLSIPVDQWRARQVIALGWYDGPLEGLCALEHPASEFYFELLGERYNPDGLDDRLYRLSELPPGSVNRLLANARVLGTPENPVWVPIWRFPDDATRQRTEEVVDDIKAARSPTAAVIHSQDMEHFLGCWRIDSSNGAHVDWFTLLKIPEPAPAP